jgi:hypothetical protein
MLFLSTICIGDNLIETLRGSQSFGTNGRFFGCGRLHSTRPNDPDLDHFQFAYHPGRTSRRSTYSEVRFSAIQYRGPGPSRLARSPGLANWQSCSDKQPQPMH